MSDVDSVAELKWRRSEVTGPWRGGWGRWGLLHADNGMRWGLGRVGLGKGEAKRSSGEKKLESQVIDESICRGRASACRLALSWWRGASRARQARGSASCG